MVFQEGGGNRNTYENLEREPEQDAKPISVNAIKKNMKRRSGGEKRKCENRRSGGGRNGDKSEKEKEE